MVKQFKATFKHTFFGILAAIAIAAALIAGCADSEIPLVASGNPITGEGTAADDLVHIRTDLGGCNIRNGMEKTAANSPGQGPVTITVSENTVNVFVEIGGNCGAAFETKTEKKGGVQYMYLIDNSDPMAQTNCLCHFTFDFIFEKRGAVNREYKVILDGTGRAGPAVISEGRITENGSGSGTTINYPVDVPFTGYSLEGSTCYWKLSYESSCSRGGEIAVINSDEELANYVGCKDPNLPPAIDFSKHTLLLAYGSRCYRDTPKDTSLRQISAQNYVVKVDFNLSAAAAIGYWQTPLIVDKIAEGSAVQVVTAPNLNDPEFDFPIVPDAQYIRTEYYYDHYGIWPPPAVIITISSREELEEHYERARIRYSDGYGNQVPDRNFLIAIERYDDNYFADNFLVIVGLTEGSGSIRHRVDRIDENGDIHISRWLPGGVGTADIASWSILIELENSWKDKQFRAIVVDVGAI